MKSVTLFVALAAIAKIAYAGVAITPRTDSDNAYCPQTTGKCNAENKPTKEIKGDLELQIGDEAKCSGTVVVENECEFKVKDFVLNLEGRENKNVYWWGSKVFNKGTGAGVKLSSKEVEEHEEKKDAEFSADENEGCWANLATDIGAVYLMDSEDNVICHAIIRNDLTDEKSGSSSSKASASTTVAPSGSGAAGATGATTTAPAAATTTKKTTSTTTAATKPADDGSSSRYLISSSALYLVLFAIAFLF